MPDATIQLANLKGVWRPVYAHRQALHSTADAIILTAWRRDTHGLDLAPAVTAWRQAVGETTPAQQHRRQAAAAAVLAALAARSWQRTRAAIALAAKRAHRAGYAAGTAIASRDETDDTPYDTDDSDYTLGTGDLTDAAAAATATSVLTRALTAAATRAGQAIADSPDDPTSDGEDVIDDGYDLTLAADVAVSAAYGAGLLAAYLAAGMQSVSWVTAGDGKVCVTCSNNEDGSPYSLLAAPSLPAHPRCRCCLVAS